MDVLDREWIELLFVVYGGNCAVLRVSEARVTVACPFCGVGCGPSCFYGVEGAICGRVGLAL